MKKILCIIALVFTVSIANAQFKEDSFNQPTAKDGIFAKQQNSGLLSFLNSDNFSMKHSVNMSYETFGNQGVALGMYTNSMMLKVMDNMNLQLDASIITSPYSTFGKDFQKQINGIYITKAAFNYRPFKDLYITFQYRNIPNAGLYSPYRGYYHNYYNTGFESFDDSWMH